MRPCPGTTARPTRCGRDEGWLFLEHRSFVLSEISQCSLWSANVGSIAASWLDQLERRPLRYHSLLNLFQLSGWHNHSRYVREETR
jgi:hypothetical protein